MTVDMQMPWQTRSTGKAIANFQSAANLAALAIGLAPNLLDYEPASRLDFWIALATFYATATPLFASGRRLVGRSKVFVAAPVLFTIFFYIIFLWPYQQFILGTDVLNRSSFVAKTFPEEAGAALYLALAAYAAFMLGLGAVQGWHERDVSIRTRSDATSWQSDRNLTRRVNLSTLIAFIAVVAIYSASGLRSEAEGRYTNTSSGGVLADGLATIALLMAMMAAAQFAICIRRKPSPIVWLLGIAAAGWAIRLVSFGDRNGFLLVLISFAVALATFTARIPRLLLALGLVGALSVYTTVETARNDGEVSISSLSRAAFDPQPAPSSDQEKDSSFNITTITLRATLASVPQDISYGDGFYKLVGVGGVLPFVRGILLNQYEGPTNTSDVLSSIMLPPNAGWSVGTNPISDLYIDFGLVGVIFGMFLIGRVARYSESSVRRNPSYGAAVLFCVVAALLAELPRYSADFPVRIAVWSAAFLFISGAFRSLRNLESDRSI